jgi:hypothetical protein
MREKIMPKIKHHPKPKRRDELSISRAVETDAAMEAIEEFENPAYWRRSLKGNLWREFNGLTLSVFIRDGRFAWSIADSDGPQYSTLRYKTEADAITAIREVLGIGET